ncbi:hypothetical protein BS816_20455 [Salmonella enterica]|uniref:hypothetical protein n=1 Tax=Salmonella enterica TaxID=28901 RepID=UPI000FB59E7E|nr:hypothetical protein [Salmonella enterica]ECI1600727.1 hypothetical protein [Salmonella enterica subsp. enterica serovar Senftenberg]EAS7375537.1 hypothetical protein [Salmonella enterica]EAX8115641.1 hypothetical protein [Salmonella enterica]EAX8165930.1 hypothetical protein [Salmonella enterica]EAX8269300.1 hypothetical protein [Salmonella enterica]
MSNVLPFSPDVKETPIDEMSSDEYIESLEKRFKSATGSVNKRDLFKKIKSLLGQREIKFRLSPPPDWQINKKSNVLYFSQEKVVYTLGPMKGFSVKEGWVLKTISLTGNAVITVQEIINYLEGIQHGKETVKETRK